VTFDELGYMIQRWERRRKDDILLSCCQPKYCWKKKEKKKADCTWFSAIKCRFEEDINVHFLSRTFLSTRPSVSGVNLRASDPRVARRRTNTLCFLKRLFYTKKQWIKVKQLGCWLVGGKNSEENFSLLIVSRNLRMNSATKLNRQPTENNLILLPIPGNYF
jgi:hypothetical protein